MDVLIYAFAGGAVLSLLALASTIALASMRRPTNRGHWY